MGLGLWTLATSFPEQAAQSAERAESLGWQGIGVVDSQNLAGDAYVALAARWAASPQALADLRSGHRARLAASPLFDAQAFARDMDEALHAMAAGLPPPLGEGRGGGTRP